MLSPLVTPLSAATLSTVVTLARVKTALGIVDSAQDTALGSLIRACGQVFAGPQGVNRDFTRRSWRVRTSGLGGTLLPIPVWPVESVSLVAESPEDYGTTVDADDYEIAELETGKPRHLYRYDGWSDSRAYYPGLQAAGGNALDYKVECVAGWLMPDEVTDWSPSMTVALGDFVRASTASLYLFEVTTLGDGTMDSTEPTWPTTLGGTVTSSTVVLTARAARRLPDEIEEAALLAVKDWHGGGWEIPSGVQSERIDGGEITYDFVGNRQGGTSLPPSVRAVLAGYR